MPHYHQTSTETLRTNPVPSVLRLSSMKLWSKHPLRPAFLLSYIVPAPKRCSGSPVSGRIVLEGSFVFSRCFFFFFPSPPLLALPWMSQTSVQLLLSGQRLHPGECIGRKRIWRDGYIVAASCCVSWMDPFEYSFPYLVTWRVYYVIPIYMGCLWKLILYRNNA